MKKRFTEEQMLDFLKHVEAGASVKKLCRKHAVGDASLKTGWNASTSWAPPSKCSFTARKLECEPSPLPTRICGAAIGIA